MEKIREYSNAAGEGEGEEQSGLADAETCLEAGVRIQGFERGQQAAFSWDIVSERIENNFHKLCITSIDPKRPQRVTTNSTQKSTIIRMVTRKVSDFKSLDFN